MAAVTRVSEMSPEQRAESVLTSGARSEFQLISEAFGLGKVIRSEYTADGADRSPPLTWGGVPAGTQEFALIVLDPDAPAGTWCHWVLYNIPVDVTMLSQGLPRDAVLHAPTGARQGRNSWPSDNIGYRGPAPPPGPPHRYYFSLYALDAHLALPPGDATAETLQQAMTDHILAEAQTMGVYARK